MNDIKTIFDNLWMITLFDQVCTPKILVLLLMYK